MGGQAGAYDTQAYYQQLADQADERQRLEREAEDQATLDMPGDMRAQNNYFTGFNRAQTDAATGRGGYNRQWVPFFEALRGKKIDVGSLALPTETYKDVNGDGQLDLVRPSTPMPEGHASWMKRMKDKIYGLKSAQTTY